MFVRAITVSHLLPVLLLHSLSSYLPFQDALSRQFTNTSARHTDCTAKAITHRLNKIKTNASSVSSMPVTPSNRGRKASVPRSSAKSAKSPGKSKGTQPDQMPDDYRRKAETYKPEYFKHGALKYPVPETSKDSRKYVRQMKKLQDLIASPTATSQAQYSKHNLRFLDLLRKLLEFDAGKRIKVADALKHPYFQLDPEKDFPPV